DGVHNATAGEDCDDAGDSETCNADCTEVQCGDGYVNEAAGEECEGELVYDGIVVSSGYCVECKENTCGDNVVFEMNPYFSCDTFHCGNAVEEECDSGGVDSVTCDSDCTRRTCGDGHVNEAAGEECDDGNYDDNDSCSSCEIVLK